MKQQEFCIVCLKYHSYTNSGFKICLFCSQTERGFVYLVVSVDNYAMLILISKGGID